MNAIYLRKSRADREAELHGEGETLERHLNILTNLAKRMNLTIGKVYSEVVSGENIDARPAMKELLRDVEQNRWEGVLVVEVERLARGDTSDQGRVAKTFKYSNTKIITPVKTYDPNDEYDEEYFEFGLFMSRREYKTINRRLQSGRLESVREGKYASNKAPFGYERVKLQGEKGYTLEIKPEQEQVVKLVFELYTKGELQPDGTYLKYGYSRIAHHLNNLGLKNYNGNNWSTSSVLGIIKNPVYIGKICWNRRKTITAMNNGIITKSRPINNLDYTLVEGRHKPIINVDIFEDAQRILTSRTRSSVVPGKVVNNPLCGLIVCDKCGHNMFRRPSGSRIPYDILLCTTINCTTVSSKLSIVEDRLLLALQKWLDDYKLNLNLNQNIDNSIIIDTKTNSLESLEKEYEKCVLQLNRTFDFLEQGIYNIDMFTSRNEVLTKKMEDIHDNIEILKAELENNRNILVAKQKIIPNIETVLKLYKDLPTAASKNEMLKEIIERVVYKKDVRGTKKAPSDLFELTLFPRLDN